MFKDVGIDWIDNIQFIDPYNGFAVGATGGTLSKSIDGSGDFRLVAAFNTDTTSYVDTTVTKGTTYWYRVRSFNANGNSAFSLEASAIAGAISAIANEKDVLTRFVLEQNYPNPFSPNTVIQYSIPEASQVKLTVFDLLGRELKILVNGRQEAGSYQVQFESQGMPAGLHFYCLRWAAPSLVQPTGKTS